MRENFVVLAGILMLAFCLPVVVLAGGKETSGAAPAPAFMDVQLNAPVNLSHLKPGETLAGRVAGNVYSGYRLVVPRGSHVRLRVSGLTRGPKKNNYLWPWPIRFFVPKYEKLPNFKFANVLLPDGARVRFSVSAVRLLGEIHMAEHTWGRIKPTAQNKRASAESKRSKSSKQALGPRIELVVDASRAETVGASSTSSPISGSPGTSLSDLSEIKTLTPGTKVKLSLVKTLSASKSRKGDTFQTLLEEPMRLNSGEVVPEGSIFVGRVTRRTPPRWLSRPGSLHVIFTKIILPSRSNLPVAASVVGVDVSRHSRIKVNSEGGMSGGRPGKGRLLLDLGVGAAISKESDDGYQLIAEALISSATDASTAGTARLIGVGFSVFDLLIQHGRNVILPPYTTITIQFSQLPSAGGLVFR